MNILFLVTESKSANGICTKAIMNEFLKKGDNVFCITNKEANLKNNSFKEDNISFFTVRPRIIYAINSYVLENSNSKPLLCRFLKIFNFVINKIKLLIAYPTWPLVSPLYSRRLYKRALKVFDENAIDCVVPVYSQVDTLIAASKLKRNNPNLMYVPYFLDSFSGGSGPKMFSREWIFKRGIKWERKLLKNADQIIMMESARNHYDNKCSNEEYFKKIKYLDLPLYEKRDVPNNNLENGDITILYAGTLPQGVRSPRFFLEAFNKIKNKNLKLVFVGDDSSADLKHFSELDERITYSGRLPHRDILEREKNAIIFLNIGNTLTNMTPSKIFEYLSWNKPIISTLPIENEPSAIYLEKFPHALLLKEYEISVDEASKLIEEFIENYKFKKASQEYMDETYKNNMPQTFVEAIYSWK